MSKLYYKHKETGHMLSADDLKRYIDIDQYHVVEFWDMGRPSISGNGFSTRDIPTRRYQYRVFEIPFLDAFEPYMKPFFTIEEYLEIHGVVERDEVYNQMNPTVRGQLFLKLEREINRHMEHLYKYGRNLDEI